MSEPAERTAVVTGGAGAIGSAVCRRLVGDGWATYSLDLSEGSVPDVQALVTDVTDREAVANAAKVIGPIDLLVNGAGFGDRAPAEEMTTHQWTSVVDVCLTGTFFASQAFHDALSTRGGTIVNIASAAATNALELHANYCAAKAGVVALTEVLALEWAKDDIRVFAVSPGFVGTPKLLEGLASMPERKEELEARTPLSRLLGVDEIAGAIVDLASPTFGYLTGTNVVIDGGWSIDGGGGRLFRPRPVSEPQAT